MKLKAKALAAAVGLASLAGVAEAKWLPGVQDDGFTGGGELLLAVWDEQRNVSVMQDLGGDYLEFWDNFTNPNYSFSETLKGTGDVRNTNLSFSDVFATSNAADIRYSVIAVNNGLNTVDEYNEPARFSNGIMITTNASNPEMNRVGGQNYDTTMASTTTNLVTKLGDFNSTFADNNAYFGDATTAPNANDIGTWGRNAKGGNTTFDVSARSDETLNFWVFSKGMEAADADIGLLGPQDIQAPGVWTLDLANSSITYSAAAVPVPAAVWLFASGLLGLGAISRRKKA